MADKYFHFTLGPVQSFVAQARRTRDFWAGSFLLSWLSAVAIQAVKAQGGDVKFPIPNENYLIWLTEGKNDRNKSKNDKNKDDYKEPQQGCIPNRFKGLVATVPADFDAQQVVKSVQSAWEGLAEEVWQHDLSHCSAQTREIWNRQVENFWEISWVLEDESEKNYLLSLESKELLTKEQLPKELLIKLAAVFDKKIKGKDAFLTLIANSIGAADSKKYENVILKYASKTNLLDRRKNWRSYLPPEEQGVKCMMMDGWQELSGIETPNEKGLAQFWEDLRNKKGDGTLKTDLRPKEYLCAIAFIKRRFAHCFKFSKEMPNGWFVHGWDVRLSVPSVSYMAAAPWLAKVLEVAPETVLSDFYKAAKLLMQNHSNKYERPLDCIDEALMKRGDKELFGDVKSLDGDIFFEVALDNKNRHENQDQAQIVKKALSALRNATNQQLEANNQSKLEPVSPFYAVLMMDGDSLGSQMSDTDKQTAISESLNHFTQGVKNKVEEHSGFLIYAGGDDVLALLPLEFALACAYDLRKLYLESFEKKGSYTKTDGTKGKVKSTLSGAIEYAHIKMPLGKVLGDAHHLLDEVAKDDCGRDSIAVRVWKPNGQHLQWAMPWKYATDNNKVIIDDIVEKYREVNKETPFSNSFFFNIEQRFAMLQNKNKSGEQELATDMEISTIVKLIAAEYLNSGVNDKREKDKKITLLQAEAQIRPLIEQCMPVKRKFKDGEESFDELKQLNIDAAHFIRFLVSKGVERG